jgi:hypothetical protein
MTSWKSRVAKCGFGLVATVGVAVGATMLWAGHTIETRRARLYDVKPDGLEAFKSGADVALG